DYQIDARAERNRRERAAELLRDQCELEPAEAGAAEALRSRRPEPAHLGDALPERIAVGAVALQHAATHSEPAVLVEIVARRLLEQLLVFREIEIHRTPRCLPFWTDFV